MDESNPVELIEKLESVLGRRLPDDYREWLASPARSMPVPAKVLIPGDPSWNTEISDLHGPSEVLAAATSEAEYRRDGFQGLPPDTLEIGGDGDGNFYLLSLAPENPGRIQFLDHEQSNPDDLLWGTVDLADDFDSWLAGLEKFDSNLVVPDRETRCEELPGSFLNPSRKTWWKFW